MKTKHVFIENDQVFLKKEKYHMGANEIEAVEWYPINLQWIPVLELNNKL